MIDKSKIAILTTVVNFNLYNITSKYFPKEIQKYVIDGRNGMHGIDSIIFMMRKLKYKEIDWLIMVDEDVVFTRNELIYDVINEMISGNFIVSGVRDGGVISHRVYNPFVINTFFSILNFKEIKSLWSKKEVLKNQYIIEKEFSDDFSLLKNNYELKSLYEPYYCFYFWLKRKKNKILFLDAKMLDDNITNSVLYNNEIFLYHTWYARSYGINKKHTDRINNILNKIITNTIYEAVDVIVIKDKLFFIKNKIKKILIKFNAKLNCSL